MQKNKHSERQQNHPRNKHEQHHPAKKKKEKCCGGHPIIHSEGEIVIGFERNTFNIHAALPFAFFGSLYIGNNNFGAVLAPYLPAGVTVTTSIDQTTGNFIFTYSNGSVTDTITMSTPNGLISYTELVESINTTYMRSDYCILFVNAAITAPLLTNGDIYTLLDTPFVPTKVSALSNTGGSRTKNIIIPRSRMNPQNTQINIVELHLRREPIKPESVWINTFAYSPTIGDLGQPIQCYLTVFINEIFDANEEADEIEN
jgi:hypothetical protein